ncbi:MAG TPA: NAD-dependent malic enzyme [Candidatus Omnitrophica bacterium]|nr:MAG: malate dehydrogenase [Omnitrophica WOR_2 bacterium GWA2_45_18]HBR15101.1 NAD-dependent malic enzyme [Candidatus Omnitrophota bacterium]
MSKTHAEPSYSNYRLTVRLELENQPGIFASVVNLLAKERANLGAVDIVQVTKDHMVRDITFDVDNEAHGQRILDEFRSLNKVKVISFSDPIFLIHLGGKIRVENKIPILTRNQLSMAYTPGVAKVSKAIAEDVSKVYTLTIKGNSVAVISDGSAILGLGNLGPEAALPVMEGKAMIFKEFAGIDAWPICLATQETEDIIKTVQHIAPVFGGINLEDISAPRCFEIEERLKSILDIPVMHDDQHGTAVVILAALRNALKLVGKDIKEIKVVVSGLGAAGIACCKILLNAGVEHLYGAKRKGVVLICNEKNIHAARKDIFSCIKPEEPFLTLREALIEADVFIGVSAGNILTAKDVKRMNKDNIVFAVANPDPEIDPKEAIKVCRIFATGRSDFPNQINNALAFPGIFRGALNVRARQINEDMKLAAAAAIAGLIHEDQLNDEYIIPSIFDQRVVKAVSSAVELAAHKTGVSRKKMRTENY